MNLKPYLDYKDSENSWLGSIPENWQLRKLRHILKPTTIKNHTELPLLSVVREKGVILRDVSSKEENHNAIPEDLSNYKVVKPGQFAMNKMKAWQGSYGISKYEGIVSPAYFIFDLKGVTSNFFHLAIRSKKYISYFGHASDGVRIGQWDLSLTRMKEIPFAIPSEDEQKLIARYLTHINNKIQKYISAKRKLIKLLEEQKQAIIHQAVTGAIDAKTGKKYLNYNSISDKELSIPSEWLYKPLKHVVSFVNDNLSSNTDENYLFKYIDISTVGTGKLKTNPIEIIFKDAPSRARKIPSKFDTIVSTVRTYLKAIYYFDENPENIIVSTGFSILRAKTGTDPNYIALITQSNYFMDEVIRLSTGTSYPAITESKMGTIKIPIPPVATQKVIIDYLAKLSMKYEETINQYNNEISLLVEYKTRLITDVVTGKVDVRKVASTLPEELEVADELDDSEEEKIEEAPEVDENESN